jgi:putative Ca2+/H+ antiporter (TMEM165/GDT1 family)
MSAPWQSALLCFSAEVGDKSFFLTAILAAWCPFHGVRSGPGSVVQQCLVIVGSASALAVHVLLLLAAHGVSARLSWSLSLLASAVQALLGLQAILQLREADSSRSPSLLPVPGNAASKTSAGADADSWHIGQRGWLGSFKAYDPHAYGAVESRSESSNPFEDSEPEQVFAPRRASGTCLLASFAVPFICVFMVEPGDRSIEAIHAAGSISCTLGALGGYVLGVIVAVMLGFLLERHLSERRLLFAAALGLWSLWLVTASQDILQFYGSYFVNRQITPAPYMPSKTATPLARVVSLPGALRHPHFARPSTPLH